MAAPWNPRIIYAVGNQVSYLGNLFNSTQNLNLNNTPTIANQVWWAIVPPPEGVLAVAAGTNITVTGPASTPQINAAAVAPTPAGTYAYPASMTVDGFGRVTGATEGKLVTVSGGNNLAVAVTNTPTGTNYEVFDVAPTPDPAGTYAYPTTVTVDGYGRVTSATGGSQPYTVLAATDPLFGSAPGAGSFQVGLAWDDNALAVTPIGGLGHLTLATSGVTEGTYTYPTSLSVSSKGIVTAITGSSGTGVASVTAGANIVVSGTPSDVIVGAATVSPDPAGTAAFPTSVTVDAYGRVTSTVAGPSPLYPLLAPAPFQVAMSGGGTWTRFALVPAVDAANNTTSGPWAFFCSIRYINASSGQFAYMADPTKDYCQFTLFRQLGATPNTSTDPIVATNTAPMMPPHNLLAGSAESQSMTIVANVVAGSFYYVQGYLVSNSYTLNVPGATSCQVTAWRLCNA
jgi:hypothetical protein